MNATNTNNDLRINQTVIVYSSNGADTAGHIIDIEMNRVRVVLTHRADENGVFFKMERPFNQFGNWVSLEDISTIN